MAPDDKLRPGGDADNEHELEAWELVPRSLPSDFDQPLSRRHARALGVWLAPILAAEHNDPLAVIGDECGIETTHPDDRRRMTDVVRDARYLIRLAYAAISGDYRAQVEVQRAAASVRDRANETPSLRDIERRRVQLLEALYRFVVIGPDAYLRHPDDEPDLARCLDDCAREVRDCDPLLRADAPIERELCVALESRNVLCRTAAKFAYALDVFGDRETHRQHPDPVSAIEATFKKALRKHGSPIVNTALAAPEK